MGKWKGSSPRRSRVIPCSLRVTSNAPRSNFSIRAKPFSTSSCSDLTLPTTASNSDMFGVSSDAPR
ncbi:Uncharacterised protein [Vibrio cholerae]|nr:Uncharacterised protein [Vibrio cholerae]